MFRKKIKNWLNKKPIALLVILSLILSILPTFNLSQKNFVAQAAASSSYTSNIPAIGFSELLGENFTYTVNLENSGSPESGFRPVVELILPPEITFVSAEHADSSLTISPTLMTVPASGEIEHPITGEMLTGLTENDIFAVLPYPLGSISPDQEAAGMDIVLKVEDTAAPQIAIPDAIQTRAGFAFGEDALNNSGADSPIYSPALGFNNTELTPLIASVEKSISGLNSDGETVTGKNHPITYTLNSEIAEGATAFPLSPFTISDELPDEFIIDTSLAAMSVNDPSGNGCTITYTPEIGAPISDGGACNPALIPNTFSEGGEIEVSFNSISLPIGSDPSLTFTGYIGEFDASGSDVIDDVTGASTTISNEATLTATYGPHSVNDTSDSVDFDAKALSIEKTRGFAAGGDIGAAGEYQPGDTVEFTLEVEVSDYFSFDNLDLRDILDDGYDYVANSLEMTIEEEGNTDGPITTPVDFNEINTNEGNHGVFDPFDFNDCDGAATYCSLAIVDDTNDDDDAITTLDDGQTLLTIDLFNLITNSSTGGNDELAGSTTIGQPARLTITYEALINESYIDAPPFDRSIDALDSLGNSVTIKGDITSGSTPGNTVTDTSSSSLSVASPTFAKEIVAINGVAVGPGVPVVEPGDLITFEFEIDIPSGDAEDITLEDFLPQPVFDAMSAPVFSFDAAALTNATAYEVGGANGVPTKNVIGYSVDTTGIAEPYPAPDLEARSSSNNSIEISWTDNVTFEETPSDGTTLVLLATFEIEDEPFDDGLQLINFASLTVGNSTTSTSANAVGAIDLELSAPELAVTKSVINTDKAGAELDPALPGHLTYAAPGNNPSISAGFPISSDGELGPNPIDSDILKVDAGDIVTFLIAVENNGSQEAFNFQITDTLPAEYEVPGGGLNLQIYDGTGADLAGITTGGLFGSIVTGGISDGTDTSISFTGANTIPGFDASTNGDGQASEGSNIVLITYDLEIASTVESLEEFNNEAQIESFAAKSGGTNYVTGQEQLFADDALTEIESIKVDKDLYTTDNIDTLANNLAIGEIATYAIKLEFPEGATQSVSFTDNMPSGMGYYMDAPHAARIETTVAGCSLLANDFVGSTGVLTVSSPVGGGIAASGTDLSASLGTVTVTDDNDATNNAFCILYDAVALDGLSDSATNAVEFTFSSGGEDTSSFTQVGESATADFGEKDNRALVGAVHPDLTVTKSVFLPGTTTVPVNIDAGDVLEYRISVDHSGLSEANAYDIVIQDDLSSLDVTVDTNFGADGLDNDGDGLVDGADPDEVAATFWNGPATTFNWTDSTTNNTKFEELDLLDSFEMRFSVTVDSDVSPNDLIENEASSSYTSLDGIPGAPVQEKSYTGGDTVQFNIDDIGISKTLNTTSITQTAGNNVTIGEQATFLITATIPEGVMTNLEIEDVLPDYMRVDSVNFISDGTGTPVGRTISTTDENHGDGINDTVTIDYTSYTYAATASQNTTQIQFEVLATVLDNVANSDSDTLTNVVTLDFDERVAAPLTDTHALTVVEPDISVTTSVDDNSNVEAGDERTFTIDIEHSLSSNSDAFELELTASLDSDYTLVDMATDGIDNDGDGDIDAADLDGEGTYNAGPHEIVWNNANTGLASLDELGAAGTGTFKYKVTVNTSATSGSTITNASSLDYSSIPGASADERSYTDSDSLGLDVETVTTITNTVNSTNISQTDSSKFDPANTDLVVGELVTYYLEVDVPQGTIPNFVITDLLPLAIEPISAGLIQDDGLTYASLNTTISDLVGGDGIDDTVTFDFGTITNAPDGDSETIIVEVVGLVLDNATNVSANNPFTSTAQVSVNGSVEDSDDEDVEIVAPSLNLSKTVLPLTGDAGDTFVYTLEIDNTGSGPAFDIEVTDTIPAGLTVNTNFTTDGLDNDGDGSTDEADEGTGTFFSDPDFTFNSTTTSVTDFDSLASGSTITIEYEVTMDSSVVDNQVLTNNVSADYDTYPGVDPNSEEQSFNETDSADITAQLSGDLKYIISDGVTDKTIRDTVPYRATVIVPEGTTSDLVLSITLPEGLAYVPSSAVITNNNNPELSIQTTPTNPGQSPNSTVIGAGQGQTLEFDFDTVVNSNTNNGLDEEIYVDFDVVVMNTVDNSAAVNHTSSASVDFDGTIVNENAPAITIVEPSITVETTSSYVSGDTITYTISAYHNAAGEPSAFDLVLSDILDANVTYDGNITVLNGPAPTVDTSGSPTITFTYAELDNTYVGANPAQFTIDVEIPGTVVSGTNIDNDLEGQWTSQNGAPADAITGNTLSNERTGNALDAGGAENDYSDLDSVSLTVTRPDLSTSSKAVVDLNGGDLQGNDVLEYTITVVNTGNIAATGIRVTDDVPADTNSFTVTSFPAGATDSSVIGGGANSTGFLDITGITLDANGGANDTKTIVFQVTVDSDVVSGTNIINNMTVEEALEGGPGATDSVSIGALEPHLVVTKSASPTSPIAEGGIATFTITVENDGDSDSINTTIVDEIPANLVYVAESTTLDGVAQTDASDLDETNYDVTNTRSITIVLPTLAQGATAEIKYQASLNNTATNTVDVTDDHGNSESASATVTKYVSSGGGGGLMIKNIRKQKEREEEEEKNEEGRDKNGVLEKIAPAESPKFHEYGSWEPIEKCLIYDPTRDLKFSDLSSNPSLDANIVKSTLLIDAKNQNQYVMSGYSTRLDDKGEKVVGLENNLTRLEWAKVLMVSHCLPIYDYEDLPTVTAFGEPMPDYYDLPFDVKDPDPQTRWMMEVAYSASYYHIINGTGENNAEMLRYVIGAELLKMLIRTGEFVHASEFERSEEGIANEIDSDAWYYEFYEKASHEGSLKSYINSKSATGKSIVRKNAVNLLLESILKRNLFKSDDEQEILDLRK